jgi:hypothetical protein
MGEDYESSMAGASPDSDAGWNRPRRASFFLPSGWVTYRRHQMADGNSSGGSSALAFIVGGLVVVVAVLGFLIYGGGFGSSS